MGFKRAILNLWPVRTSIGPIRKYSEGMHFLILLIVSFAEPPNSPSVSTFVQHMKIINKILFSVNLARFFHLVLMFFFK
jgi:hypothetical protein